MKSKPRMYALLWLLTPMTAVLASDSYNPEESTAGLFMRITLWVIEGVGVGLAICIGVGFGMVVAGLVLAGQAKANNISPRLGLSTMALGFVLLSPTQCTGTATLSIIGVEGNAITELGKREVETFDDYVPVNTE